MSDIESWKQDTAYMAEIVARQYHGAQDPTVWALGFRVSEPIAEAYQEVLELQILRLAGQVTRLETGKKVRTLREHEGIDGVTAREISKRSRLDARDLAHPERFFEATDNFLSLCFDAEQQTEASLPVPKQEKRKLSVRWMGQRLLEELEKYGKNWQRRHRIR